MKRTASDPTSATTRRRFLQTVTVATAVASAGCIEEIGTEFPKNEQWPISEYVPDLPVAQRTAVLEERIAVLSTDRIADPDALASKLSEYELAVESIERKRDVLTIEYVNTDRREEGTVHDLALLAGGYAALVEGGYEAAALEATILDDAPASYGSATVETPWAAAYNAGELTAAEYGELVVTTIKSQRSEPQINVSTAE
ncbi:twin-arginine translocation signal domain-containing protein [Natrinema halophilum]|uniref:Twin-arginine translocation signal domain-containing protein n=1 Tax=Natrinema halophilum TaxID=1699371 RepID=A0A7D5H4W3_9EURY|nr:twin-arginine translocation signal domain-containing protein [Natrinema halophilum]QLG47615.1 twin-arginine translocation signal domain-containing protein [Natrinema halophilum]